MSDILDTPAAGGAVLRGGVLRVLGYVAGTLLSLVAASLLARHLGPSGYGRYVVVTSLVVIVGGVTEGGISSLGVREFAQLRGSDRDRVMRNLLGLRIALTVVGVGIATGFAALAGYDHVLVLGTVAVSVGLLFTVLAATIAIPLSVSLRFRAVTGIELLRQAATVVGIVVLVAVGAGLLPFFAVQIPVGLLLLAVTARLVRGEISLVPEWNLREWRPLLTVTLSLAAANAASTLYVFVSVIVMSLIASARETGYFGASFRVFIVLGGIAGLAVASAFPVLARAARDDRERLRYALHRVFEVGLLGGGLVAVVTAVGAPVAIDIIGGSKYDPAVDALRIQSIGFLATFGLAPMAYALIALHDHRGMLLSNLIAFVVSLSLVAGLAPGLGARGAAIGSVTGEFSLGVAYLWFLLRDRADLRPRLSRPVLAVLAGAIVAGLTIASGLPAVPATIAVTAVYVAAALALRAVPGELLELVPGRLRLRRWPPRTPPPRAGGSGVPRR